MRVIVMVVTRHGQDFYVRWKMKIYTRATNLTISTDLFLRLNDAYHEVCSCHKL